jgi:CheY-like chemotaxis protein
MSDHPAPMDSKPDGKLILVVDDEFDVLSAYTMLFEYRGYRVRTAPNGVEALAAARQQRPDLVLSDYMMPLMNGAELCTAMRADPSLSDIPFILASAGILAKDVRPPYDMFFRKPVAFDTLLAEISKLLAQRD